MATEVRYILFSPDEIRAAVARTLTKRQPRLTDADVTSVKVAETCEGAIGATARLQPGAPAVAATLDRADLLAALLLFCADARIPWRSAPASGWR